MGEEKEKRVWHPDPLFNRRRKIRPQTGQKAPNEKIRRPMKRKTHKSPQNIKPFSAPNIDIPKNVYKTIEKN